MYATDWAWRASVREFGKGNPEGITLLALAYLTDLRLRAALGSDGWWKATDMAGITGLGREQTTEHLRLLHKRGLVERTEGGRSGARVTYLWRMPQAARRQHGAVHRARPAGITK